MNYQECDYYRYLSQEELKDTAQFISCPKCRSLAVLLSSTTNIQLLLEEPTVFEFEQEKIGPDAFS